MGKDLFLLLRLPVLKFIARSWIFEDKKKNYKNDVQSYTFGGTKEKDKKAVTCIQLKLF